LRVAIGAKSLLLLVAHGPPSSHMPQEVHEWWGHVTRLALQMRREGEALIVMVDANARIGSVSSLCIAFSTLMKKTRLVPICTPFLAACQLRLPATSADASEDSAPDGSWT
jgi:hypothetical protein